MSFGIIDYKKVTDIVNAWEKIKDKAGLDLDEEKLVLDILMDRRAGRFQKLKTDDYLSGMGGGIFKGLLKKATKEIKEDDENGDI